MNDKLAVSSEMQKAMVEIREVLTKYDLAGLAVVGNNEGVVAVAMDVSPSWSRATIDPAGKVKIIADLTLPTTPEEVESMMPTLAMLMTLYHGWQSVRECFGNLPRDLEPLMGMQQVGELTRVVKKS